MNLSLIRKRKADTFRFNVPLPKSSKPNSTKRTNNLSLPYTVLEPKKYPKCRKCKEKYLPKLGCIKCRRKKY